jgi:hypothetical protein
MKLLVEDDLREQHPGATDSSVAVMEAVRAALKEAGGR